MQVVRKEKGMRKVFYLMHEWAEKQDWDFSTQC